MPKIGNCNNGNKEKIFIEVLGASHYSKCFVKISLFNYQKQPNEATTIIIPVLEVKILRP